MKILPLVVALATGTVLVGCDQSSNQSATRTSEPAAVYRSVLSVGTVVASRPPESPGRLVVQASGTVGTTGWSDARLQQETSASGAETVVYRFVAKPPSVESIATKIAQPIETILRVGNVPTSLKTVRVVAETNENTVTIKEAGKPPSPAVMPPANSAGGSDGSPPPAPANQAPQ